MTRGLTSLEIAGIGLVGSRGAINAGCELTVVTFPFKLFPWGSTAGSHQNDPTFPSRSIEMPAGYGAIHVMTSGIDSWSDGSNKFVMHYHLFCQPTCKSQRPTTPSSSGAKRCVHFHNVTSFLQQICIPVATSSWVPCLALPFAQSNFQFPSQARPQESLRRGGKITISQIRSNQNKNSTGRHQYHSKTSKSEIEVKRNKQGSGTDKPEREQKHTKTPHNGLENLDSRLASIPPPTPCPTFAHPDSDSSGELLPPRTSFPPAPPRRTTSRIRAPPTSRRSSIALPHPDRTYIVIARLPISYLAACNHPVITNARTNGGSCNRNQDADANSPGWTGGQSGIP